MSVECGSPFGLVYPVGNLTGFTHLRVAQLGIIGFCEQWYMGDYVLFFGTMLELKDLVGSVSCSCGRVMH